MLFAIAIVGIVIAAECGVFMWDICGRALQLMEMCVDCIVDWQRSIQSVAVRSEDV